MRNPDPHETGYEVRRLPNFARRHYAEVALLGAVFVGAMVWAITRSSNGVELAGAITVMLVVWFIGFRRERKNMQCLRCPSCDQRLRREREEPPTSIVFECHTCAIVWDTGFNEAVED